MPALPPVDPPDDDEIWFREDQDEEEYLERIGDLEEQLTRQTLENEQLLDRLRRERKERQTERREDSRWYATQRTAVTSIAVIVVVAVLGSILYQISILEFRITRQMASESPDSKSAFHLPCQNCPPPHRRRLLHRKKNLIKGRLEAVTSSLSSP